jgi:hypothetical protein
MLSQLGGKSDSVAESSATCRTEPVAVDPDSDFDFDPEDERPQQAAARNALTHVTCALTITTNHAPIHQANFGGRIFNEPLRWAK